MAIPRRAASERGRLDQVRCRGGSRRAPVVFADCVGYGDPPAAMQRTVPSAQLLCSASSRQSSSSSLTAHARLDWNIPGFKRIRAGKRTDAYYTVVLTFIERSRGAAPVTTKWEQSMINTVRDIEEPSAGPRERTEPPDLQIGTGKRRDREIARR